MWRISFRALSVVLAVIAITIAMATSVPWLGLVLAVTAVAVDRWRPGLAIVMLRPGMNPVTGGPATEKWGLHLRPAWESWMLAEPVNVEGSVECPRLGLRMQFSFFAESPAGINFLHGLVKRHESVGEWVEAELSRPGELFDRPCFSDKGPAYDVEEALYTLLKNAGAESVEIGILKITCD